MENLKKLLELAELLKSDSRCESSDGCFEIDKSYFVRTVTYHYVGKLVSMKDGFIGLKNCSWIADSGRFSEAMENGIDKTENSEIEPFPKDKIVYINISGIIDISEYNHKLPTEKK